MGYIDCKSLFKTRGEAAIQESFMEVARQDMEQRRMTGVPGSLDTTHEALALCLSLPGNLPWCHWPGVGRFRGKNQALRHAISPWKRMAGAAAGGNSWCLSLEPNGCVCINPSSLEPPRLAGGPIGQNGGNGRGVGSQGPSLGPHSCPLELATCAAPITRPPITSPLLCPELLLPQPLHEGLVFSMQEDST